MKKSIILFLSVVFIFSISVGYTQNLSAEKKVLESEGGKEEFVQIGIIEAISSASLIVQITLFLLCLMSIISWAIIFSKWNLFKSNTVHNKPLEDIFFKMSSLDEILNLAMAHPQSSLAHIFRSGYSELKKIIHQYSKTKTDHHKTSLLSGTDNLERALSKAVSNEISFMEKRLSFLATVGSVSPFIGLFGTVFGIMNAFQKIGLMGSANLAVVAPGIAEALIATGVGLFAAIPAAGFYNHFVNEVKRAELIFNNFVTDFLNITKRNFFK